MTDAPAAVDVSVIVCTRNRRGSLERTLESIDRSRIPAGLSVELLVVDNGSTDGTTAWLHGRAGVLPLRVLQVEVPGQTRARNAALSAARGGVLAWTDDDVEVEVEWLERLARPILSGNRDAVAGRVVIPETLLRAVAGTPLERRIGALAFTDWTDWEMPPRMVGANMAFGRHVLSAVPAFDERLGPGPESLGFHDETLFAWRLLEAGYRLGGAPDAVVQHHFDASRLDPASILSIASRFGRSTAYVDWHWNHQPAKRWIGLRRVAARVRHRLAALGRGPSASAERRYLDAYSAAYFEEFRRCMGEPRIYPGPRPTGSDRSR